MQTDLYFLSLQLPSVRRREVNDRERLADAAHRKQCAKHKGRNHWRNWERRKMAADASREAKAKADKAVQRVKAHHAEVAAYWRGERESHPTLA